MFVGCTLHSIGRVARDSNFIFPTHYITVQYNSILYQREFERVYLFFKSYKQVINTRVRIASFLWTKYLQAYTYTNIYKLKPYIYIYIILYEGVLCVWVCLYTIITWENESSKMKKKKGWNGFLLNVTNVCWIGRKEMEKNRRFHKDYTLYRL